MKYIIYFIAAVIICGGCNNYKKDDNRKDISYGVQVLTIKGCEFVVVAFNSGVAIVHHPDCHNKFHNNTSVTSYNDKIDFLYLDSNGVVADTMRVTNGGGDYDEK